MALTCELCGSTDFVKDAGLFVCRGCGMKYTLEEAQRLMGTQTVQSQQATAEAVLNAMAAVISSAAAQNAAAAVPELRTADDFHSGAIDVAAAGPKETNNYACRAWQMLLTQYKNIDHPAEARQKVLVERARECLTLLDDAAMLDPNNHVLGLLIYENCQEIVSSAKNTSHYVKDDEGNWKRKNLDYSIKVSIPGMRDSFEKKADDHRKCIEQEYLDAHPQEVLQRERLVAQAEEINGRLNELKSEKRSHGFFDFSGKREVKDRMKPVEDELRGVRSQINALDNKVDDYVELCLRELGKDHVRLDF